MEFIRGKLSTRRRRTVIFHLLGCDPCRQAIAPVADLMFRPGRAVEPEDGGGPEYDGPVYRAISFAVKQSHARIRERAEAEATLARMGEDWQSVRDSRELWTWGLCEALLDKSWSFRHEDSREMLRFAKLAREAADRLDPKVYGEKRVFDMQARAWGEYGNACRVTDDLLLAEWAFQRALELRSLGSGSPILRARLAELTAGLLCHQRQFQAALRALDLAYSLYRRHHHALDALRVQILRGIYTGRSGDPEMGLLLLAQALDSARENQIEDSKLSFIALHNILLFRVECGEFREANIQLFEMRALYARHAGSVDALKLRWIEGRIAAGLGEDERAERVFVQVRDEFNKRGQVYHSAIAGLDLAALWLRKGRHSDVKRVVGEILEVFRTRHVARETIAALLMLRNALEKDRASLALIVGVAALIEQHQGDSLDNGNAQP
jgi:tetratricopeptide (TPR) repeat protein